MSKRPTPDRILEISIGYWASKVLMSAVEIGVFTELVRRPDQLEAVRSRLGLHPRAARDFLDALVAMGLLERRNGIYSNTPEAEAFLDKRKSSYLGGILEMANRRQYGHWAHLTEALRTGQPQGEVHDGTQSLYAAIYADPARMKTFLGAMFGHSYAAALALAENFPWEEYQSLTDVGCGQGYVAARILQAYKHLAGTGFDLPEVEPIFDEYVEERGLGNRLHFQPGNFFKDAMPKADVILLGRVLLNWDLETKRILLAKAYVALPMGGSCIVYDEMIDDERKANLRGLLMSLNMVVETADGFGYTCAECQGWMLDAGFRETRVEPLAGGDVMVVGVR